MLAIRVLVLVALLAGSVIGAPQASAQIKPGDAELLKSLLAGGMVVVLRHATADPDRADTEPLNFRNIRAQQPLTEAGKRMARALGTTWHELGVTFSEVLTSRFNRAYQTAVLAGFKNARPETELTEGSLVVSPNEQHKRAVYLRQLTAAPVTSGHNRLIVTHRANIAQAFGKEWFDVKEGEASVFRSERGAYVLVARLQADEWARLLPLAKKG